MLAFVSIVVFVLVSLANVSNAVNSYPYCHIMGDPYLTPFEVTEGVNVTSASCDLRSAPIVFFRNKFIKIEIVNSGGRLGNIVSFIVSLLDESESDEDVCTFTEQYFKLPPREYTCGLTKISINESIIIDNLEADVYASIHNGDGNYNIYLQTSLASANSSKGLCRDGCTSSYTTSTRSLFPRPIPQDQTISSLAEQICDIYIQEFTKVNSYIPSSLKQFVGTARQGCITDVTNMGEKKYAKQTLTGIISTIMTFNATSLRDIQERMKQASITANNISKIADQITAQLIANYKTSS